MATSLWARIRQPRFRWPLRLLVLLAAAAGVLLWSTANRPRRLVVENRSGQPIAVLRLTVAGVTKTFENVTPGAEVSAPYPHPGEDAVAVEVKLADGTVSRLDAKTGPRTNLVVLPGGHINPRPSRDGGGP